MKRLSQLRAFLVCTVAFSSEAVAPQPKIVAGIREWVLEATNGFGNVTAIERCGDTLFIADAAQRIRRFNLAAERLMDDLGGDRVAFPTALMADCPGRRLFVITAIPMRKDATAAVQVFDSESGELRREYALPRSFLPRPGGRFEPPDSLIVSGLWVPPDRSPASLVSTAAARYYEGLRLGVKLLLHDGEVEPLLVPYETVCIGAGQCPDVRVDSITTSQGTIRVAGLPTSQAIGVYDGTTLSPRRIDVQSPMFVRDGTTLEPSANVDARMRWFGRNSNINQVFAFRDAVAIVHARPQLGSDYHVGQPTPFTAFVSVYAWDGRARARDMPLPELAVGRDADHLYAVEYIGGRGASTGKIRLVQVPIPPGQL
jgi:hypothetical protein